MKRTNPEVWDLATHWRTLPRIIAQRFLWITAAAFFAIAEIDRISYKTGPGNLVEKTVLPDDSSPSRWFESPLGKPQSLRGEKVIHVRPSLSIFPSTPANMHNHSFWQSYRYSIDTYTVMWRCSMCWVYDALSGMIYWKEGHSTSTCVSCCFSKDLYKTFICTWYVVIYHDGAPYPHFCCEGPWKRRVASGLSWIPTFCILLSTTWWGDECIDSSDKLQGFGQTSGGQPARILLSKGRWNVLCQVVHWHFRKKNPIIFANLKDCGWWDYPW